MSFSSLGLSREEMNRRVDFWLVRVVGALVVVMGALLAGGAARGRPAAGTIALGLGSAAALGGTEVTTLLRVVSRASTCWARSCRDCSSTRLIAPEWDAVDEAFVAKFEA
jgi:hypothetical protein